MFGLGMPELVVILVLALIVFGAGKLPDVAGSLGKGIREFKKSMEHEPEADKTETIAKAKEQETTKTGA